MEKRDMKLFSKLLNRRLFVSVGRYIFFYRNSIWIYYLVDFEEFG